MDKQEFVKSWINKISQGELNNFPEGFIDSVETETLALPAKTLILGAEFFGSYEILDIDGNLIHQADDHSKAKYILYSNRLKPEQINIPIDDSQISDSVKSYEIKIDELIKMISKDVTKELSENENPHEIINTIFNTINLKRY